VKDHEIAQVVNRARDIATKYGHTQQLRAHLSELLAPVLAGAPLFPVPMLLFCPVCANQHIDRQERDSHAWCEQCRSPPAAPCYAWCKVWANPPHRSHKCHTCGAIWRPADVPTTGVARIETKGDDDTWSMP
jgi:hypothetical protein